MATWSATRHKLENEYLRRAFAGIFVTLRRRIAKAMIRRGGQQSIISSNLLIRIFALLDRRVGKRKLLAMKEQMPKEAETVQTFYRIRMAAEGLC